MYTLSSNQVDLPLFKYVKSVGGISRQFEIVPSTINNSDSIYESDPVPGTGLTYTYRTDGGGDNSNNTGFFFLFKQGTMQYADFTVDTAITNYIKSITTGNINDTDVWLYKLDQFGQIAEKWTQVSSLSGNNAIYNSLSSTERNIYNVVTKSDDKIDLVFGDGNFSNLPLGSFRSYHRISDNVKYAITPADMQNISFAVPYTDNNGAQQTLSILVGLKQSVYNSAAAESNLSLIHI